MIEAREAAIVLIAIALSISDSVTTHLCFRQYPDKELKGEANPFMRRLMLKNGVLAEVFKQGGIIGLAIWSVTAHDYRVITLIAIMLSFVVLNNTTVLVTRAVTKKKITSPTVRMRNILHLPEKYDFVMAMTIIIGMSLPIWVFVVG